MAFPSTALNATVELALGADLSASPSTWVWTDVTQYVFEAGKITITRGRPDGAIQTPPSIMKFSGNNTDGRWCEHNPTGAWYGQIGKGTPIRVLIDEGTESKRFTGQIVSLPPRWDTSENFRSVEMTAAGVMRRLGRGTTPLRSALTRTFAGSSPIAFWPGEDGSSATTLAEFSGGAPMTWVGSLTPSSDGPSGGGSLPEFTSSAGVLGVVPNHTDTGGWGVACVFNFPTTGPTGTDVTLLEWTTSGSIPKWRVVLDAGSPDSIALRAYDSAGTQVVNNSTSFEINATSEPYGQWLLLAVGASQNGSNIDYAEMFFLTSEGAGVTSSVAGTAGRVLTVGVPQSSRVDGMLAGYWAAWDYDIEPIGSFVLDSQALDGYAGYDSVTDRVTRLGSEESISVEVDAASPILMGSQPTSALLDIFRESETAAAGILYDNRDWTQFNSYLHLVTASDLSNQAVDLALNHDSGHIAPGFEPEDDDQQLRNDWTAYRPSGSSARVVADSGNLTPTLVGTYADSVTTNVETDEQLPDQAGWRVNLGTVEGLRFPQIQLNLRANPSLIPDWIGCDIGSRITISNPPPGMPPDDIDVLVVGYTETLGSFTWDVTLNCTPYESYRVFEISDDTADSSEFIGRLAGDDKAAIRGAIDSDDLSIPFDPNRYRWTTVADDFDPDMQVRLGGEVVEVSSISTTAATYVAAGAASHADNAAVTPALYAGATANDLILLMGAIRSSGTGTISATAGYTRLPVFAATDHVQIWAKVHDGTESDPTVTPSGGSAGDTVSAFTFGLRNMPVSLEDLADLVVDSARLLNSSAQNIAYPGLYPWQQEGCVLLLLAWKQDNYSSIAAPSGWTEVAQKSTEVGNDQALYAAYQIQTTPAVAPEGSLVVTGGAAAISRAAVVALPGGYQTMTVSARSVNGVTKSHAAGTKLAVEHPGVLGL